MYLRIELLSDTAFGRGDGVAGVVDNEVEHDPLTGLPVVKGRTIKGLIVEACADILFGLSKFSTPAYEHFKDTAAELFGIPGSMQKDTGILHFHSATLPLDFVKRVQDAQYPARQVLEALTSIRRQTAVDPARDTPMDQTLRATRVVLRHTIFHAPISVDRRLEPDHLALLAACAATVRHAGLNRTRGLGHIRITLADIEHQTYLAHFDARVREMAV